MLVNALSLAHTPTTREPGEVTWADGAATVFSTVRDTSMPGWEQFTVCTWRGGGLADTYDCRTLGGVAGYVTRPDAALPVVCFAAAIAAALHARIPHVTIVLVTPDVIQEAA